AIDEFGGVAGIVTLEQLVEEIVGSMGDELAGDRKEFTPIDINTFEVDGGLGLDEANEEIGLQLPTGKYQTVAGFILSHLGRIPKQGEQFKYRDLAFVITQMRAMKIEKVVVTKESND
ncbi:MAG: transporter associated domain-containing protein, partial [Chloroflexota bacterium]|nr:transporter associated domain-containing protein [Chloroflexota bacterium]